jgi:hypothetical protein
MRTLAIAFALLLLLPAAAVAKTGISLNPPPDGLAVGEPWDVTFSLIRHDAVVMTSHPTPSVNIVSEDGAIRRSFRARRGTMGQWVAQVYFPRAGTWNFSIQGFGKAGTHQYWDPVHIAARTGDPVAPKPPVVAADVSGGSSFPFGWVGAGCALLALAAGLLVARRRA